MALTILIGGVRAGKSSLAVALASQASLPVTFIATARPSDEEMAARIDRHRAERPGGWETLEVPVELGEAIDSVEPGATVIVDCLTLWASNLMLEGLDDGAILGRSKEIAAGAAARPGPTIVVTNEVGSGVHPHTDLGRRFADLLGRVNAIWSLDAAQAYLVVAGRSVPLTLPSGSARRP